MKYLLPVLCLCSLNLYAQLPGRFELFVRQPVRGADGGVLEGSLPSADQFGFPVVEGCLVQILNAGPDGVANPPDADGTPGGDDTIIFTTAIGAGVSPNQTQSGMFSVSFAPPPAQGDKLYVRVFDAATVADATHWGQSAVGTVAGERMDIGALGLWGTTQATGVDTTVTDSDGDGASDWEEAQAGTAANQAGDAPKILEVTDGALTLPVVAGRAYTVYRSTDDLGASMSWQPILSLPVQSTTQALNVSLPDPPVDAAQVFYKFEVQ